MIIRRACSFDIPWMISEGANFLKLISSKHDYYNPRHLEELLKNLMANGILLVAEENEELRGAIGGIKHANIYNPDITDLSELFWWVPVKYRKGRAGYMLMKEFEKYGDDCDNIVFSSMDFSPINTDALTKRGYKKKETAFLKEN